MEIKNKIIKSEFVAWRDFNFIQPEGFKELSKESYEKLKSSIVKNGFVESFKVWENGKLFCLDGYHRCKALDELAVKYDVPDKFHADFIDCKDRKEAAKLVLVYSSIYAHITEDGLYEMASIEGLNWDDIKTDIELPDIDLEQFEIGYLDKEVEMKQEVDLKEIFEIVVECDNETEQQQTYNKLTKQGYKCRVLTL